MAPLPATATRVDGTGRRGHSGDGAGGASANRRKAAFLLAPLALASVAFPLATTAGPPPVVGGLFPPRCERRVGDLYETQGTAVIDKVGDRYVLTLHCDGIHQIYVRLPATMNLDRFVGKVVHARYTYTDDENPRARCIRAPCPPATERVLELHGLEEASESQLCKRGGVRRPETGR